MTHLERYLQFYQSRTKPGYAVLVTGEWGTGKTFQVKRAIPEDRRYYVSLFGMQSTAEIYAAVFSAMFPGNAKTRADVEQHKSTSILGIPIGALASQLSSILIREKVKLDRTLIFDDLERCKLDPNDLLAVVNRYVEHHECRVVVIAHEGKLPEQLLAQREKTFGQIIKVTPEIDTAYAAFSEEGEGDSQALSLFRDDLIELFKDSEAHSLRILRHLMQDTLRLYGCLTPEQQGHLEARREVVRLFAALNLEVRAGRLRPIDLQNRTRSLVSRMLKKDDVFGTEMASGQHLLGSVQSRYKTIRLDNDLLSDDLLESMLVHGVYDCESIQSAVSRSLHFADQKTSPAWRIFIEFQQLPDSDAEAAKNRMEAEFALREIVDPGDILHVFALRFMMAANGLLPRSQAEVLGECRAYIDDLRAQGRLIPSSYTRSEQGSLNSGYAGFAFWVEESYRSDFVSLAAHLRSSREAVMLETLDKKSTEILELVETNGEKLFSMLNYTSGGGSLYAAVPILSRIDPDRFVESWMKSHPKNWYWIQKSIEDRISAAAHRDLASEVPWAGQVVGLLLEQAENAGQIRRLRIRRHVPHMPA